MKRIITPVDFTSASIDVVKYASLMALELNAKLTLFHVIDIYQFNSLIQEPELITPVFPLEDLAQMEMAVSKKMDQLVNELTQLNANLSIDYKVASGSFINELINETHVDETVLVIVPSSNHSDLLANTKINLRELYYESACPVIIIPPQTIYTSVQSVLFITSLTKSDIRIVDNVFQLFKQFNFNLKVWYSVAHQPEFEDEIKFLGFQQLLKQEQVSHNFIFRLINHENLAKSINQETENEILSLVVIHKENKNYFKSILDYNSTHKLAKHLHVPVMLYGDKA